MGQQESQEVYELPPSDIQALKGQHAFTPQEIRDVYQKFREEFPDGTIPKDLFIEKYQQMFPKGDAQTFAENVFRVYDADENGYIDFREFLVTLSASTKGSVEARLQWVFNMYDLNGDGSIDRSEVASFLVGILKLSDVKNPRPVAEDMSQEVFLKLDKNQDNRLTLAEFIRGARESERIMVMLVEPTEVKTGFSQ